MCVELNLLFSRMEIAGVLVFVYLCKFYVLQQTTVLSLPNLCKITTSISFPVLFLYILKFLRLVYIHDNFLNEKMYFKNNQYVSLEIWSNLSSIFYI